MNVVYVMVIILHVLIVQEHLMEMLMKMSVEYVIPMLLMIVYKIVLVSGVVL